MGSLLKNVLKFFLWILNFSGGITVTFLRKEKKMAKLIYISPSTITKDFQEYLKGSEK